jgi:cell division protein FtsZ
MGKIKMNDNMEAKFIPTTPSPANNLLVLGVGGAGENAINSMIVSQDCPHVEFIAANTDAQALANSKAPVTIQLGRKITKGLGAGSNPDTGRRAAEEDIEEIKKHIAGADILFLAAGFGGGTGTGAVPVIAKAAKEMGILTVAVVTKPFAFEGRRRIKYAEEALQSLKNCIDTMIVVPNEKLLEVADPKISIIDAFALSNSILKQAVKGISDIIQKTGLVNVDFADVKAIMKEMGVAIMGTGRASGTERAKKATLEAINSPLLENVSIEGAKGILFNITGNRDLGLHEINDAAKIIYSLVNEEANIILGSVIDESMGDEIMVTVIATGLNYEKRGEDRINNAELNKLNQRFNQGSTYSEKLNEQSSKQDENSSSKNRNFPFF